MAKNTLLRVTQMNATYLDIEIEKSFQQIIQEAIKHLPPGLVSPITPEIQLLLRLGILKNSILADGSTFGQQLLNIQYTNMTESTKYFYILFKCLDYFKKRCEQWRPSHGINNVIFKVYILLKVVDFLNLSIFLRHGTKPLLIERVLGLEQGYVSGNLGRTFESKYLARELLWNGFIEILVYMVPLINYYKLKRLVKQYNPFSKNQFYNNTMTDDRLVDLSTRCAHCRQKPILPHHMGCIHVFCYVCLKGNQVADAQYECPICEHRNPNILCDKVTV